METYNSTRNPKFFAIEQSAEKLGGHYIEYATRILRSVEPRFETYLVSNRKLKVGSEEFRILPIYKLSYFKMPSEKFFRKASSLLYAIFRLPKSYNRIEIINTLKTYYLIQKIKKNIERKSGYSAENTSAKIFLSIFISFTGLIIGIVFLFPLFFLYLLFTKIFRLILSKQFVLAPYIKRIRKFYSWKIWTFVWSRKQHQFKRDTLKLFSEFDLTKSDILFFCTIGLYEIFGLINALDKSKVESQIMIILRRDPEENFVKNHNWQFLGRSLSKYNIKLFADTSNLAELYSKLFGFEVGIFPIAFGNIQSSEISTKKIIELSYLGDARDEKGFTSFANVAEILSKKDIEVFSQMNQPGLGSYLITSSINRLLNILDGREISLTPLETSLYQTILANSEIVYLNYVSKNYKNRSSGIFVEAIAAGANIITSCGSWMHREIEALNFAYFKSLDNLKRDFYEEDLVSRFDVRGILIFDNSHREETEVKLTLNTGVVISASGWKGPGDITYVAIPLLNKSEFISEFNFINTPPPISIIDVPLDIPIRAWGFITSEESRVMLEFEESQRIGKLHRKNVLTLSAGYTKFHSEFNILNLVVGQA